MGNSLSGCRKDPISDVGAYFLWKGSVKWLVMAVRSQAISSLLLSRWLCHSVTHMLKSIGVEFFLVPKFYHKFDVESLLYLFIHPTIDKRKKWVPCFDNLKAANCFDS
ncbi:hypothetical protein AVEN_231453-1 [Araneus ventricosus]|uniref:Uncharacterized protein n=1 Tax=Araneus ventricosus TaxID=182803 RepID=A0A4Y2WVU6_ARAVE|nr:hypothetical protein AVEN_231453-1 [Araneus ventricosus]